MKFVCPQSELNTHLALVGRVVPARPTKPILSNVLVKIDEENQQGETPLIKAAKTGHKEVVKLLLEKGATLDLTDFTGRTALDHAKQNRHPDVVRLLSEASEE